MENFCVFTRCFGSDVVDIYEDLAWKSHSSDLARLKNQAVNSQQLLHTENNIWVLMVSLTFFIGILKKFIWRFRSV